MGQMNQPRDLLKVSARARVTLTVIGTGRALNCIQLLHEEHTYNISQAPLSHLPAPFPANCVYIGGRRGSAFFMKLRIYKVFDTAHTL